MARVFFLHDDFGIAKPDRRQKRQTLVMGRIISVYMFLNERRLLPLKKYPKAILGLYTIVKPMTD